MAEYLAEYLPVLVFLAIAIGLAAMIVMASYMIAPQHPEREKLSAYECGLRALRRYPRPL